MPIQGLFNFDGRVEERDHDSGGAFRLKPTWWLPLEHFPLCYFYF
jgi:hypothetical protein